MISYGLKQWDSKFKELKADRIQSTLEKLSLRIQERFPDSGLSMISAELEEIAKEVVQLCLWLQRPLWPVRVLSILAGLAIVAVAVTAIYLSMRTNLRVEGISDLLQTIESGINEVIFLAIALFFLSTLESRIKRKAALKVLHQLRSIAHVVDMHQLTKDPAYLLMEMPRTPSSPHRPFTAYELSRYFDYCTELLSITSKLAALHAQYLNEPVVLNAVNDVESLAHNLAAKVAQKAMLLDLALPDKERKGKK